MRIWITLLLTLVLVPLIVTDALAENLEIDKDVTMADTTFVATEDVIIKGYANMTLDGSELSMKLITPWEKSIRVQDHGRLILTNESEITSNKPVAIYVVDDGELWVTDSIIESNRLEIDTKGDVHVERSYLELDNNFGKMNIGARDIRIINSIVNSWNYAPSIKISAKRDVYILGSEVSNRGENDTYLEILARGNITVIDSEIFIECISISSLKIESHASIFKSSRLRCGDSYPFDGKNILIDTTVNDKFSPLEEHVTLRNSDASVDVYWYITVEVKDKDEIFVKDVSVELIDALFGDVITKGKTNDTGLIRFVALGETINRMGSSFRGNYIIHIDYEGHNATQFLNLYESANLIFNIPFSTDSIPPEIKILSHEDNEIVSSSEVIFEMLISDNVGVESIELKINNEDYRFTDGKNSFSEIIKLSPGKNLIQIRAHDQLGNERHEKLILEYVPYEGGSKPTPAPTPTPDISTTPATSNETSSESTPPVIDTLPPTLPPTLPTAGDEEGGDGGILGKITGIFKPITDIEALQFLWETKVVGIPIFIFIIAGGAGGILFYFIYFRGFLGLF